MPSRGLQQWSADPLSMSSVVPTSEWSESQVGAVNLSTEHRFSCLWGYPQAPIVLAWALKELLTAVSPLKSLQILAL